MKTINNATSVKIIFCVVNNLHQGKITPNVFVSILLTKKACERQDTEFHSCTEYPLVDITNSK